MYTYKLSEWIMFVCFFNKRPTMLCLAKKQKKQQQKQQPKKKKSVWPLMECLPKDKALVTTLIPQDRRDQPPTKRVKLSTETCRLDCRTYAGHLGPWTFSDEWHTI